MVGSVYDWGPNASRVNKREDCLALSQDVVLSHDYLLTTAELETTKVFSLRWALEIILVLDQGPTRYKELSEAIPISQGTLSKRLVDLREMGIINRESVSPQDPRKYLYSIHPDGASALRKVCRAVRAYAATRPADGQAAEPEEIIELL